LNIAHGRQGLVYVAAVVASEVSSARCPAISCAISGAFETLGVGLKVYIKLRT
jgi:hypothetical protein